MAELVRKDYWYTIRTSDQNFYMGKVVDSNDIFTVDTQDGFDVITKTEFPAGFIQMKDAFVIVQTVDGPIPVEYSKMPGGSKLIWINPDNINSFNVIDSNSKLVSALDQISSGVITAVENPDLAQSSRGLKR